jgi:hypothetical protein
MSAPKPGRESPDPEEQHGQQKDPPASGLTGTDASMDLKELNKKQLEGLQSNPVHPLAQASEEKTSKKSLHENPGDT